MKERSLIIFTLLSQLAAGIFIILLGCFTWFLSVVDIDQAIRWCTPGLIVVAGAMAAATITSLFHLGNPHNAWRAASNFRSSWLSREIILIIAFTAITLLMGGIAGSGIPLHGLLYSLGGMGAMVGVALVYVMSRIYCQRTVPTWNTWQTLVHFFLTTLALGAAGSGPLLALNRNIPYAEYIPLGRAMSTGLVAVLLLQVATLFLWLNPANVTGAFREALNTITGKYRWVLTAYLTIISLAIVACSVLYALSDQDAWAVQTPLLNLSGILVYIAEFFGRGLFYIARVRQGV